MSKDFVRVCKGLSLRGGKDGAGKYSKGYADANEEGVIKDERSGLEYVY